MIVTILIATALLLLCALLLAIGLLLTGKSKLKKRCGSNPECDHCDHCDED